ncbi:MAG: hypothetical protein JO353_06570 [Phycisphaerae bacterium]|nr:hypothetical protein [Phycisphaerae bacterium]
MKPRVALFGYLILLSLAARAFSSPTTANSEIDVQITRLTDPDPTVRKDASDRLVAIGDAARAALQSVAQQDDPQLSDAARQVLQSLPWSSPSDPDAVKAALTTYGVSGAPQRIGIVAQLGEMNGPDQLGAQQALLRLLSDELNEDVCWQIAAQLLNHPQESTLLAARAIDIASARHASLLLSGCAWLTPMKTTPPKDVERAHRLLGRAIELEAQSPTYDDGLLDTAFDELVSAALNSNSPAEALRLRRLQCKRIGVTRDSYPSPFFALLTIYERYGPLAGFEQDLTTFDRYLARPESLGILSRIYRRAGKQMMAAMYEELSLTAALMGETQRLNASFLMNDDISDLAAAECRQTLARADNKPDSFDIEARLTLAQLAARRDDHAVAADQFQFAEQDEATAGDPNDPQLAIAIAGHRLKLAEAQQNPTEIAKCMDELMAMQPSDTDSVIDLVPVLKKAGRVADAKEVFERRYRPLKAIIDADSASPVMLNELAWLDARCDEHLDEAVKLSREAVAQAPINGAYLDTCAEATFRAGDAAEAARLESKALENNPGDLFMIGQLKRFRAAAATRPTTGNANASANGKVN